MGQPTERTGLVLEEPSLDADQGGSCFRLTRLNVALAFLTVAVIATSIALPIAIVNSQPRESAEVVRSGPRDLLASVAQTQGCLHVISRDDSFQDNSTHSLAEPALIFVAERHFSFTIAALPSITEWRHPLNSPCPIPESR